MVLFSNIEIKPSQGNPHSIIISRRLHESWNLTSYPFLTLKCGREKQIVESHPGEENGEAQLLFDPRLFHQFHLPAEPALLKLAFDPKSGQLELGPIIAVLTFLKNNTFDGPLVPYCKELARYCEKQHVLFYVFTLKDWRRGSVAGYMWRHYTWDRHELPMPHVIYNRIGQRNLEKLPATIRFFESLSEKHIHYFNAHFLDKREVHEKLSAYPELLPYLPETVFYDHRDSLEEMILRHDTIFLKPSDGRQGKHIFRIHNVHDHLELDYTTFNGEIERSFTDFNDLYEAIKSKIQQQPYMIQRGLTLLEYKQCPLDFRMLCNRGHTGEWKITSGIARVSSEDQFVSNLARGGSYHSIMDILNETFQKKHARQVRQLLSELALEVADVIAKETNGLFGELGVDLAIDQQGKPWIIEVNTKPSKDMDPDREPTVIRPSAKAVIDYGSMLSGFAKF
ncbi:MAG TPA: YheC/YheD family protein [Bacillales bacterium]|nr:YheC/YheD family protein [Bacillales bacterium]